MSSNYFLFNIKYKNKRFAVYTDKYHQKNFLRILDDNSLCYPDLEDYIKLDNIFNIKKLDKLYITSKPINFEPKVIIDDKNGKTKKDVKALEENKVNKATVYWSESPYGIKFVNKMEEGNFIYIFCENEQEIRQYLDIKNPSFNDVKIAVSNNSNIPDKYKKFAFEYIDELENFNPNQDLAILYYNMSNLRNIKNSITSDNVRLGYFNKYEKEIAVAETGSESTAFKHELAHATHTIDIDLGNVHVLKDIMHPTMTPEHRPLLIGMGANEGLTDNLRIEMGGKTLRSKDSFSYEHFQDEMQLCCKILEIPTDELLNNNIRYFMDKMYEKGIYTIPLIVSLMDATVNGIANSEIEIENVDNTRHSVYCLVFENLIQKLINEGKNSNEIYKYIFELLDSGYIQNEIKKDSDFAMNYLTQQLELRETIIELVNILLQKSNMQTKSKEQLMKEFTNFETSIIKDFSLSKEINNMIGDLCVYKDINEDLKLGYVIKKIDGFYQILNFETLDIVDIDIEAWEYAKTLLDTDKVETQSEGGLISFHIKPENIELSRKLTDSLENSDEPQTKNIYTYRDSNGEIKTCYFIITLNGEKVFYDFNMNRITPTDMINLTDEEKTTIQEDDDLIP